MKKTYLRKIALIFSFSFLLTSCYTYTDVVGKGAQGNNVTKEWNHYLLGGLAPIGISDSKEMAKGAENYEVTTEQSIPNIISCILTGGMYCPTTTTVRK